MTQVELAERLGVDQKTISVWEAGLSQPRPYQRLIDLAQAIEIPVAELLEGDAREPGRGSKKGDAREA